MTGSLRDACTAWVVAAGKGRYKRTGTGRIYRLRPDSEEIVRITVCPYCRAAFYDRYMHFTLGHRAHLLAIDTFGPQSGETT